MIITTKKISIGTSDNNCYVVYTSNNIGVVVDAPDSNEDGGIKKVVDFIKDKKINIKYILITHGHYDHIGGLDVLKNKTAAEVVISKGCSYMLEAEDDSLGYASPYFTQPKTKGDIFVEDGDILEFDEVKIKVHLTPGHTKGDTVYEIANHLYTGDTLFAGDIGRADLPGGNLELLIKNLKKLLELDESFKVHPGHGPDTTISHERRYNHYLK